MLALAVVIDLAAGTSTVSASFSKPVPVPGPMIVVPNVWLAPGLWLTRTDSLVETQEQAQEQTQEQTQEQQQGDSQGKSESENGQSQAGNATEKPAETEASGDKPATDVAVSGMVTEVTGNGADSAESEAKTELLSPEALRFQEVVLGKVDPTLSDFRQLQQRVNELVSQLRPAVVGIRMGGGQGSGVIVSGDGYVLTAAHVVGRRGQRAEIVMPDGSTHPAIVLGTDSSSDAGMLRMVEKGPWPYAEIGESDALKRGQWLLALGHPGGFDPDRSSVVRVGRLLMEPGRTTLQTDCTLVGGDSGGPLFDLEGRVIGIHSRISRRIQQNYHVSVDIFTSQWDEMSKEPSPTLGFRIKSAEVTDKLVIDRVNGDGPAEKAGLKPEDQILKFDGVEVKNRDELRAKMGQLQLDQKVKLTVLRDNAEVELELQVELK
ncbi:MAG: trypsin-like peptidase domain-containing protein [Planctomycetaceae bacterium]|nr:trypsin-like peptidase domain-containing protein [Planctomycetaceae bacterium]